MLRIEKAGGHNGYMESRRLMWAYAHQGKISYFHLLCHEKSLYALYDEDVFCGCAVQGSLKGSACVLCLFPNAMYCGQAYRAPISELLTEAVGTKPLLIDFLQITESSHPAALRPLRQT